MQNCIVNHHIRVFVSFDEDPIGIGFYDDFDLSDFDNDLDRFFSWYSFTLKLCHLYLDHYELY